MSSGAYEWSVLIALKLLYLKIGFPVFTAGMVQRKPQEANGNPTCE